jgi:arylsulfatase A-like enzyme
MMPVRTPELDRFSERAVSLSNLYTGSFPTIPHRTDLTTARIGWPWYPWQDRRKSSPNHAPAMLSQAGYVSQLLCDCPHLFRAAFDSGFSAAQALRGQESDMPFLHMNHPIESVMPPEKTRYGKHFRGRNLPDLHNWANMYWRYETDRFPPRTASLAMHWLEENYEFHPFFLWVDFFDPHEPWDPPEYMVKRYDSEYDGYPMVHPNYGRSEDLTDEELHNMRAHYNAEAELVDRWVGRILQKIDDLALWDDSVVIFTTDHGMSLGEHTRTGKSNINPGDSRYWPVYPEVAHIPCLIAAPGLEGGRTVDALLQPYDILPTVLDLAGVEIDTPEPFHGRSFAPMLRGEAQVPLHDFVVTASYLDADESGAIPDEVVTPVLYTHEWAYVPIGAEGERELYALASDPYAEADVAAEKPGVVEKLHDKLIAWLREIDALPETLAALTRA